MIVPTFVELVDAVRILARRLDDLEKRIDDHPMMRVHHNGPGKIFVPDDLDDHGAEYTPADDPDAPVLCPNCGAEMERYVNHYYCRDRINNCPIVEIDFLSDTSQSEAAAIVRRMRGAR